MAQGELHKNNNKININIDDVYSNLLIYFKERESVDSVEGDAFVTIGVDENGKIAYISIEPEDEGLKKLIKKLR